MTLLSISLEKKRILIVQFSIGTESPNASTYLISRIDTIETSFDLYEELLDKGNPKYLSDLSKQLSEKLDSFSENEISISLNLTGVKFLNASFNRNLSENEFDIESQLEATLFLQEPNEFSCEEIKLVDSLQSPFESYLLAFLPKRYITRVQMLFLPSKKNISFVELSHFAVQRIFQPKPHHILLELEDGYLAISKLLNGIPQLFKFWPLEAETDIAYFAVNELKQFGEISEVSAFGELARESVLEFISSATGFPIKRASLPLGFSDQSTKELTTPPFVAMGCALKAIEWAE